MCRKSHMGITSPRTLSLKYIYRAHTKSFCPSIHRGVGGSSAQKCSFQEGGGGGRPQPKSAHAGWIPAPPPGMSTFWLISNPGNYGSARWTIEIRIASLLEILLTYLSKIKSYLCMYSLEQANSAPWYEAEHPSSSTGTPAVWKTYSDHMHPDKATHTLSSVDEHPYDNYLYKTETTVTQ